MTTYRMAILAAAGAIVLSPLAGRAWAQVATTDAAKVPPGSYRVEPGHTRVVFSVSHMGFSTWYGDFSGATGTLEFSPRAPTHSALMLTIPVGSVTTTNATLDGELKSAAWFDAATYPTITFQSTGSTTKGHGNGTVTGNLTFHGVTHPVTLQVHFNGGGINPLDKKYTIGFDATGSLSRSAFGVKTYVPMIGDTVTLMLSGAFEAAK